MKYKTKTLPALSIFLLLSGTTTVLADQFAANTNYTVCFTPGSDCTNEITKTLNHAQQSILVQAFSITSYPIENALIYAKSKGIDVKLITDKNQYLQFPQPILYLAKKKISIWIDGNLKGLAHNKVIIIDNKIVITGSFNFTKAAQKNNAENLLIIEDSKLAEKYTANWQSRLKQSQSLQ